MVSLAKTPAEVKQEMAPIALASPEPSPGPQYPYGCCLCLDDDTLAKLGMGGEMPAPGDVIEFMASATVTSASKDASTGKCRVELQITDMDVNETEDPATEAMERSEARRERFYGKAMNNYQDAREAGSRA